jgi:nucleoside-diphosphate-sugar epimerase
MIAAATAPDIYHSVINVGSGVETSVRELVNCILEITESKAEVLYTPRSDPGVSRMCADLTKAYEILGYRPAISLEEGINLTIENDERFHLKRK